jgi:hypothetical protein
MKSMASTGSLVIPKGEGVEQKLEVKDARASVVEQSALVPPGVSEYNNNARP